MKNYYLFIIIAAISICLNAQNKSLTEEKLNLVNYSSFKIPGEPVYSSPLDGWAVSEMITQLWVNDDWSNMARTNYTYGANGLMTNDFNYTWNGSGWDDNMRTTYTYYPNNLLETTLSDMWEGGSWVEKYKSTYTYDGQGKMLTCLSEVNTIGVWENSSLNTYTYTGSNLTELKMQNWLGGAWENIYRSIFEYNPQGVRTTITSQMWLINDWINSSNILETYNQNNLIEFSLVQTWLNEDWVDNKRNTYTYNVDNKLESLFAEVFVGGNWETDSQNLYTYDGDGNNSEILMQHWVSGNWENFYRVLMSYEWTTGVETNNNAASEYKLINNYPNPFNPSTTIKFTIASAFGGGFTILKVYDILGNEVATLVDKELPAGNYEMEFDAGNLSSGIYFYQLKVGSFIQTKKMVLLR